MDISPYFKSIIDQDTAAVVICDLDHTIIYMNAAAIEQQSKRGGAALIGRRLLDCHNPASVESIHKVVDWFSSDESHNRVHTFYNPKQNKDGYMVALRDETGRLIGYYEKHEYRDVDGTPFYEMD